MKNNPEELKTAAIVTEFDEVDWDTFTSVEGEEDLQNEDKAYE